MIGSHSQPPHSGIDFQVNVRGSPCVPGQAIKSLSFVETIDDRGQLITKAGGLLPLPESAKAKNRFRNPSFTELDSFFRQRHSKPVSAFLFEAARAFDGAVSIRVGFYGGEDLHVRSDVIPNHMKVMRQRIEMDFGPRRPAGTVH